MITLQVACDQTSEDNTKAPDDNTPADVEQSTITITSPVEVGTRIVKNEELEPLQFQETVNIERDFVAMEQYAMTFNNNISMEPDPSTVTVISPNDEESGSDTDIDTLQIIPQGIPEQSIRSVENGSIKEEQNRKARHHNIWMEPGPKTIQMESPMEDSSESETEDMLQIIPQGI